MADTYSWAASVIGGGWQQPGNWTDETTQATATTPPNAANAATVTGGTLTNFQILTGPGTAASLAMFGNTALEGPFSAGSVTIGSTVASLDLGAVDLENHSTLAAGGSADLIGDLELDGTKSLFTSPLLVESDGGTLYALDSATLLASTATIGGYLFVDPAGIAEIGTLGGAGAGSLTVDAAATLTLVSAADIAADIALAGSLAVLGAATVSGDVDGTGDIAIAAAKALDIFGSIDGLATISDGGVLTVSDSAASVGLITLGSLADATFGGLTAIGTVLLGTGAFLRVDADVTGGGAIEVGSAAELSIAGTASGLGRIDVASNGIVAFTALYGTIAPHDINVPINLGAATELLLDAGVTIGGLVSGFAIGDLIAVSGDDFNPAELITGATLASGTLLLTDDGTVANAISLASAAGTEVLTNAVGLAGGLPTGGSFAFGTTDIFLASGTITGLPSSGAVTVTGATGTGFQVLDGSGTATSLTFFDNTALEGSFAAAGVTIATSTTDTAINAVDLQPGATLAATAGAVISSNAEIDGAAARFTVAGTLTMAGGELLVVNGGTAQATALTLNGTGLGATLDVDAAGAIEIGTLADAQTGALLVDTGATLANLGNNEIIGTLVDQGTIALTDTRLGDSVLTTYGNLSGSGVLTTGTQDSLIVDGNVTGLSRLVAGDEADITISGSLASPAQVSMGTLGVLDVSGNISGLAGLTIATGGQLLAFGGMTGIGPVSIGSLGVAEIERGAGGTGGFTIGQQALVSIGGLFTGFSQATLANSATLTLGGTAGGTDTVPILLAGTADTLGLTAGLNLAGIVTGFAVGDLIHVIEPLLQAGSLVTGATLAGGTLTLTADGTIADTIAMAGNAGQQFLVNSVGLPDLAATDIVLPTATLTALGSGGSVTGAAGVAFDVLTGSGSAATLALSGNLVLEGSFSAGGSAILGGTAAQSALDIEYGGALSAASVVVESGVEVDGAGASLITAGTITLGGGLGLEQLFAANSGLVQAAAILLGGSAGQNIAELAVDPAGRMEVGTTGLSAAGTLTIDAGHTLTAAAQDASIAATIADDGLLSVGSGVLSVQDDLSGAGTLALAGGAFAELQDIAGLAVIAAGATADLSASGNVTGVGTITAAAGASIGVTGSVATTGGISIGTSAGLTIGGDLSGGGTLLIGTGASASVQGTISGLSAIVIGAGGTLDLGSDDAGVPILMGADSTLLIQPFGTVTGTIEGFASGDAIAVAGAPATIITEADDSGGALLLSDDGALVTTLNVAGSFAPQQFLTNVAGSSFEAVTDITLATPCFARGTGIATARGRVAVETLRVGDAVHVLSGGTRPVVWIGHRRVDCRRHPRPELVWPVLVRAHAFAPEQPARDLRLSPDHAVFADGVLIPVKYLVNGRTIRQLRAAGVSYFHVELDRHDVLWAEGLASESYLDTGNRAAFADGPGRRLHPDFAPLTWDDACAELVQDGPRLHQVRRRLFARAGGSGASGGERPPPAVSVRTGRQNLVPEILGPGLWRYTVPKRTRHMQLISPSWMPAACEPASLDRRTLGVRLFGVAIDGQSPTLLGELFGGGCHPPEMTAEGACRWTDGRARLRLPPDTRCVTLHIGDGAVAA